MANYFKKCQVEALKLAFDESENLTKVRKLELARETGLDMEQISSWFNRKRTRKRSRESIGDLKRTNAELQVALNGCQERELKLQKVLQDIKATVDELEAENQYLGQRFLTLHGNQQLYSGIR